MYLHAHHPDIMRFLDTKRKNTDEKIRIKTLSLGVVIPDITFELAKNNEDMCLFSPYDVECVHGVPFADIDVTGKYREMVDEHFVKRHVFRRTRRGVSAFRPEDVHTEDARNLGDAFADIADTDDAERFAAQVEDGQFVQAKATVALPVAADHRLMVGQKAAHRR